jgi:hypothetical protein
MQCLFTAVLVALSALKAVSAFDADPSQYSIAYAATPVPVTLGVMSKCPDARVCESIFDDVLKTVGHNMIDIRFSFIGKCVALAFIQIYVELMKPTKVERLRTDLWCIL